MTRACAIGTQQGVNGSEAFTCGRVEIIDGFPRGISARSVIARVALAVNDDNSRLSGR